MFDFQKLDVYKKAKAFYLATSRLLKAKKFDRITKDQLKRAAFSIPLNIAEGSGRFSKKDRRNFFIISRSSIFECAAIFDISLDEQIINQEEFDKSYIAAQELSRMLYAMIKNLE